MTSILREGKSKWNHSGVKVKRSGGMEIQWEKTLHLIHVGSTVESVAVSPNGQQVVSGSYDQTVRIWNVQTGQQIGDPLHGHTGWVSSVAFSPDGQQVVSGSHDQTVRIWNVQTGQQIGDPLHGHTNLVTSVAFSPDGQQVVSGSWITHENLECPDRTADWRSTPWPHNGGHIMAFSPDGQQVVAGSADETVRIGMSRQDSRLEIHSMATPAESPHRNLECPDRTADWRSTPWPHGWVTSVAFSPDGQQVVSGSYDETVRIWNVQTGQKSGDPLHGHTSRVTSVAFPPDGQQVVSGSHDQTVRIWNVQTGQQIGDPLHRHTSQNLECPDRTADWDPLYGHTSVVTSVAFSCDGQQVVSGSADQTVRIWNVKTGQQIGDPLYGHTSMVTSVAFSPDGQQVVSGSADETVVIWNVQTGQQIGDPLHGHTGWVTSVHFHLMVNRQDSRLDIHSMATPARSPQWHFSPDGQQVVSGSEDKTVRIWNVQTGQQIGDPLHGHTSRVTSLGFSPDGQQVVSGSHDNMAGIWDVHAGRQVGLPPIAPLTLHSQQYLH
ncbi:hypothetical protein D9757_015390 [Collybiopsis confluens]|uniref:WD40 repeat-like protein n=1 Tax=Collybiopsis confluens TaxID=2823264 RepID=A0A8H5CKF6_9AGAR|nr:hypothetical protein D9757_015390 [Collybiopsis confluens]